VLLLTLLLLLLLSCGFSLTGCLDAAGSGEALYTLNSFT
jgi:hypothetical protein